VSVIAYEHEPIYIVFVEDAEFIWTGPAQCTYTYTYIHSGHPSQAELELIEDLLSSKTKEVGREYVLEDVSFVSTDPIGSSKEVLLQWLALIFTSAYNKYAMPPPLWWTAREFLQKLCSTGWLWPLGAAETMTGRCQMWGQTVIQKEQGFARARAEYWYEHTVCILRHRHHALTRREPK
jgi:hypothetical protein